MQTWIETGFQEIDPAIVKIQDYVRNVDQNTHNTKSFDAYMEVLEKEAEGMYRMAATPLEAFFYKNNLEKIVVQFQSDRENLTSEYYFLDGSLVFAKKTHDYFDPPIWDENSTLFARNTSKYYFDQNILIYWVDDLNGAINNPDYFKSLSEGKRILMDIERYLQLID